MWPFRSIEAPVRVFSFPFSRIRSRETGASSDDRMTATLTSGPAVDENEPIVRRCME